MYSVPVLRWNLNSGDNAPVLSAYSDANEAAGTEMNGLSSDFVLLNAKIPEFLNSAYKAEAVLSKGTINLKSLDILLW